MSETRLRFKREEREGVVAVGSYLSDAARRLGVRFEDKCDLAENEHFCRVTVIEGGTLLTPLTSAETEYFKADTNGVGERLACQAKITGPGEIEVMTKESKKATDENETASGEEYAKQFAELPLEKKIAELVRLEAITLGDTFAFIFNSPYTVFDKVMGVMAGFGMKKEEAGKQSARPAEHAKAEGPKRKKKSKTSAADDSKPEDDVIPAAE